MNFNVMIYISVAMPLDTSSNCFSISPQTVSQLALAGMLGDIVASIWVFQYTKNLADMIDVGLY